jgi:hypothetical protein
VFVTGQWKFTVSPAEAISIELELTNTDIFEESKAILPYSSNVTTDFSEDLTAIGLWVSA